MGILKKITKAAGVDVQTDEVQVQADATRERQQEMINIYWFLRQQLDEAIAYFFQTGSYDELEKVCQGTALERVKRQLAEYQNRGITWSMSDRRGKTQPQVAVLNEKDHAFICEEKFLDFSVLQLMQDGRIVQESKNPGQPSAANATVVYDNEGHYWFADFFLLPLEG